MAPEGRTSHMRVFEFAMQKNEVITIINASGRGHRMQVDSLFISGIAESQKGS